MPFKKIIFLSLLNLSLFASSNARILNGNEVLSDSQKYKSTVAIVDFAGTQFCGGTLISPTWVLTAAHCIKGMPTDIINVLLDTYDLDSTEITTSSVAIKKFIIHPDYEEGLYSNDIALIELPSPVSAVPPMAINSNASLKNQQDAWVAGWGRTSSTEDTTSNQLLEVLVPIIDISTCNAENSYGGSLTNSQVCAGYMDGSKDSCQGDSGGPLIIQDGSSFKLAGIVSFGGTEDEPCGAKNLPGVYTNVASYLPWINSYVKSTTAKEEVIVENETTKEPQKEATSSKTALDATDVLNFNFNQWYLAGTTGAITDLSIFDNIEILLIYQDGKFKGYSPNSSIRETLRDKGYEILDSIPANSGMWIKK